MPMALIILQEIGSSTLGIGKVGHLADSEYTYMTQTFHFPI